MRESGQFKHLVVAGPTASGKSALAMEIAASFDLEIVSCDSVQLYRRFDIGSAKPSREQMQQVPHHMIDIIDWSDEYDAANYAKDATEILNALRSAGKYGVVAGGTGLYLRALWQEGWDNLPSDKKIREELQVFSNEKLMKMLMAASPQRASEIHIHDRYRLLRAVEIVKLVPEYCVQRRDLTQKQSLRDDFFVILLLPERETILRRIEQRTHNMLNTGLIDEVSSLLLAGCPPEAKPMQSIGYKQVAGMLKGDLKRGELEEAIHIATRQYAKRQKTWFSKIKADLVLTDAHLDQKTKELLMQKIRSGQ